jgi:hypothetical protein
MVELLLALPAILLLGLGIVQFTLVYQAKHALDHALTQAARQGAVDHASVASIRAGLAAGLVPYLYGASEWSQLLEGEGRAAEHVKQGIAAGWIRLVQWSPTSESFGDWAEPALDETGEPIAGMVEIPNDNLDNRRLRTQPVSGVAALHLSEPVGRASGQTLADANLLRLELVYGVRLVVPVVAPVIIRTLSALSGCATANRGRPEERAPDGEGSTSPGGGRLGLLVLAPVGAGTAGTSWMCAFLAAQDGQGRPEGRIPLRVSATVRMMSTARRSDLLRARVAASSGEAGLASGNFGDVAAERPPGSPDVIDAGLQRAGDPGGEGTTSSRRDSPASGPAAPAFGNGFLSIGSDRAYRVPAAHPALCPS